MNISKTTMNFAARRGLELTIENTDDAVLVCVWEAEEDSEWIYSYRLNADSLTFNGNIYAPRELKEELPGTIFTEKQFREVLDFTAREMKH